MKQYATLEATVYFWFAANDTSGSGGDGATPLTDVRLAGAAADAIPVLSPTPTLLSHANYPAGCYEVAVAATNANGFAANNIYAVFCTLAIDSQNPTGFIGSFDLKPVEANAKQLGGTAQTGNDVGADVNSILENTDELQADDIPSLIAALPTDADVNAACDLAISDAALATASILKEVNQSLNGAKCVIDRAASTFEVYDTDGETLMFTITKATVGNVDTLSRT